MADYPDWTDLIQILGSDIQVPIDIQGAYIMLPVDIQAQYVTLDIDIVAQTVGNIEVDITAQTVGNIDINIAASAITLDVDITAQTVGNIDINIAASAITLDVDITAQTVGNIDVNIAASAATIDVDVTAQTIGNLTIDIEAQSIGVYSQPEWAAKEQTDVDYYASASIASGAEGTAAQYTVPSGKTLYVCQWGGFNLEEDVGIAGRLTYYDAGYYVKSASGGHAGFSVVEHKPIRFTTGQVIRVRLMNFGAGACTLYGGFNGYLVTD